MCELLSNIFFSFSISNKTRDPEDFIKFKKQI